MMFKQFNASFQRNIKVKQNKQFQETFRRTYCIQLLSTREWFQLIDHINSQGCLPKTVPQHGSAQPTTCKPVFSFNMSTSGQM